MCFLLVNFSIIYLLAIFRILILLVGSLDRYFVLLFLRYPFVV